ncbi:hypothetical protein L1049_005695 [Liquidambar formosana]|uniref:Uncharacterized protein n=1 Tax=Liquidambar formosana TaxID=63359 RepID=A0AAP0REP0_LIQFO
MAEQTQPKATNAPNGVKAAGNTVDPPLDDINAASSLKRIQETHGSDASKTDVDVKSLLPIIEDFLKAIQAQCESFDRKARQATISKLNEILKPSLQPDTLCEISCQYLCKSSCGEGEDSGVTVEALLKPLLSRFTWSSIVVITLAAFCINFSKFFSVSTTVAGNETVKTKISELIKITMDVTKRIVELKELPSKYLAPNADPIVVAIGYLHKAVFWTVRSTLSCTSQITTTEVLELSQLTAEGTKTTESLWKKLQACYKYREVRVTQEYENLVETRKQGKAILEILIADLKENKSPLYRGSTKQTVGVEAVSGKTLFLVISDLELSEKDVIKYMYDQSSSHQLGGKKEIVWLPVVDGWTDEKKQQFKNLKESMPWCSIDQPWSSLDLAVTKYIKETWCFKKLPLLVVVDPLKKVDEDSQDLNMIWIKWASSTSTSTSYEEEIWKKQTFSSIWSFWTPAIIPPVEEAKYICLYGGEDIEWIRKFTKKLKLVAQEAKFPLEMYYMGKSDPGKKNEENIATIFKEGLSSFPEPNTKEGQLTQIRFFWLRLLSIWLTKEKRGQTMKTDLAMRQIGAMLSVGCSSNYKAAWAVITKESFGENEEIVVVRAKGDKFLECLNNYDTSKPANTDKKSLLARLKKQLHKPHTTSDHCSELVLPITTGSTDMMVACVDCDRAMKKFITFRCCTD